MSKKNKEEKKDTPYLGRPGNSVQIGIVGMPNVGKSTIFNIMSNLYVAAENYPFCTIDPNVARVPVPDDRFDKLVEHHKPASVVPAVLQVTDIAGLVKGAHAGKGLGNAFLSHITACDAIFHLVRAFNKKTIDHVEGSVDPVRDLEIISNELRMKDLERLKTKVEAVAKIVARGIDKTKKAELDTLTKAKEMVESGTDIRFGKWNNKDVDVLNAMQLLSAKPVVFLVNISQKDFLRKKNKWLGKIHNWVKENAAGSPIIPFSAEWEQELHDTDDKDKFIEETKGKSQLPKIITTGYHALDLVHFFTCGADEVRAWTIRRGTRAPQAAGVIHTDFEKGFICAETYAYADFEKHGSEADVKAAGRYLTQGKQYVVQDGDIIFFKSGQGKKKKK